MTSVPDPDPELEQAVNPPAAGEAAEARADVDDMDERVFGGEEEERRQEAERPAAVDATADAGPDDDEDPMEGAAPSG